MAKAASKNATKKESKPAKKAPSPAVPSPPLPADVTTAIDGSVIDALFSTVTSRRGTDPALSHSARLLSRGTRKIAQKFGEEAVECLIEAVGGNKRELIGESADVLYHLVVMWVDAGVTPAEVWAELHRREAMSGVEEKASRPREQH